jgi:hypothetical protein
MPGAWPALLLLVGETADDGRDRTAKGFQISCPEPPGGILVDHHPPGPIAVAAGLLMISAGAIWLALLRHSTPAIDDENTVPGSARERQPARRRTAAQRPPECA